MCKTHLFVVHFLEQNMRCLAAVSAELPSTDSTAVSDPGSVEHNTVWVPSSQPGKLLEELLAWHAGRLRRQDQVFIFSAADSVI